MNEWTTWIAAAMPTVAIIVAALMNATHLSTMNGSMSAIEQRMLNLENRLDSRIASLESKFDILTGKVVEVDNRLTRVEEQLKHR